MKKFVAVLLVLATVLAMTTVAFAASAKFTKADVKQKYLVQFQGSLYAYNKASASSKSNIIVKKGSIAELVGISANKKWVQLRLTTEKKPLKKWFGVDKLKNLKTNIAIEADKVGLEPDELQGIRVIFAAGGSGHSTQDWFDNTPAIKNMTVKTTGKVNLRNTASLAGKSLGVVKKGKTVKLTGKIGGDTCGVTFLQVKYKGTTGYISTAYVRESDLKKVYAKRAAANE